MSVRILVREVGEGGPAVGATFARPVAYSDPPKAPSSAAGDATNMTGTDYVEEHGLLVGGPWHNFVCNEALPGSGVDPERFWAGLARVIGDLGARNAELLEVRASLQAA